MLTEKNLGEGNVEFGLNCFVKEMEQENIT